MGDVMMERLPPEPYETPDQLAYSTDYVLQHEVATPEADIGIPPPQDTMVRPEDHPAERQPIDNGDYVEPLPTVPSQPIEMMAT